MWWCNFCISPLPSHPKTTWFDWKTGEVNLDPAEPAVLLIYRKWHFTQCILTNGPESTATSNPLTFQLPLSRRDAGEFSSATYELLLLSKLSPASKHRLRALPTAALVAVNGTAQVPFGVPSKAGCRSSPGTLVTLLSPESHTTWHRGVPA